MGWCQTVAGLWPDSDRATACAVCTAESGGDPTAHATIGEDSRGLFQINVAPGAHPQLAAQDLYDPWVNAENALTLWQSSGWQPWTTYTSGRYQQFLGGCGGIPSATAPSTVPLPALPSLSALVAKPWFLPAAIVAAVILASS